MSAQYQELDVHSKGIQIRFEKNELLSMEGKESEEKILRYYDNGRVCRIFGGGKSELNSLLNEAKKRVNFAEQISYTPPTQFPNRSYQKPKSAYFETLQNKDLKEIGEYFISRITKKYPELAVDLQIESGKTDLNLSCSGGDQGCFEWENFHINIMVTGCTENDIFFWGCDFQRLPENFTDFEEFLTRFLHELDITRRMSSIKPGKYPVLFHPNLILGQVLKVIESGFSSANLENGTSPLLGKTGERLLSEKFTLEQSAQFVPFDLDGIEAEPCFYFKNGILERVPVPLSSSKKLGLAPNGANFSSGFASDLKIHGGSRSHQKLIESMDDGLLLIISNDLFMGQILNGPMQGTVQGGFHVKNGKVLGRVKNNSVAFNFYEHFKDGVKELSSDTIRMGTSFFQESPYFLVDGVEIN